MLEVKRQSSPVADVQRVVTELLYDRADSRDDIDLSFPAVNRLTSEVTADQLVKLAGPVSFHLTQSRIAQRAPEHQGGLNRSSEVARHDDSPTSEAISEDGYVINERGVKRPLGRRHVGGRQRSAVTNEDRAAAHDDP